MANREQFWRIGADFTDLVKESSKAAASLRTLKKAKDDYNKSADRDSRLKVADDADINRVDRLSDSLNRLAESKDRDNESSKGYARALRELATNQQDVVKSSRNYNTELTKTRTSINQNETAMQRLNRSLRESVEHKRNASDATRMHADTSGQAARAHDELSAAVDNSADAASRSTRVVKQDIKVKRDYSGATARAAQQTKRLGNEVQGVLPSMTAFGRLVMDTSHQSRLFGLAVRMLPLTGIVSGIQMVLPALSSLGGSFIALTGTLVRTTYILGSLPSMFTGVVGGIVGAVAGLSGAMGALEKYNSMQEALTKESARGTREIQQEERTRRRETATTQRSLERAYRDRGRLAEDLADAERNIGEVAEDNARRVEDAEQRITEAHEGAADAQKAVEDARRSAARQLQDYRDQLRGLGMDEEAAAHSLQRARAELAKVMADPGSTMLQRRSADLAVRQAELNLKEVREQNERTTEEANQAMRKGVEGSDEVVAARKAEADAQKEVVEAQKGLTDVHQDNADATRAAKRSLEDARWAYEDSATQIAELEDAVQNLNDGFDKQGKSIGPAATQVSEYEAALAALGPQARRLVTEYLIPLTEAWDGLKDRAGEAFAPGLMDFFDDMNEAGTMITDWIVDMADGFGRFFGKFGDALSDDQSISNLNDILADSLDFMNRLGDSVTNFSEMLLGLGAAARRSGLTRWVADTIERWTAGWAEFAHTPEGIAGAADTMRKGMEYAEQWGRVLANTWNALGGMFDGLQELGDGLLQSLVDLTGRWNDWANSDPGRTAMGRWLKNAQADMAGISGVISTMVDSFSTAFARTPSDITAFWEKVQDLIRALAELLGIVDGQMIDSLMDLGISIMGILQSIGEGGGVAMVTGFVDVLGNLANIADTLLRVVPGLTTALSFLIIALGSKKIFDAVMGFTGLRKALQDLTTIRAMGYTKFSDQLRAFTAQSFGWGAGLAGAAPGGLLAAQQLRNQGTTVATRASTVLPVATTPRTTPYAAPIGPTANRYRTYDPQPRRPLSTQAQRWATGVALPPGAYGVMGDVRVGPSRRYEYDAIDPSSGERVLWHNDPDRQQRRQRTQPRNLTRAQRRAGVPQPALVPYDVVPVPTVTRQFPSPSTNRPTGREQLRGMKPITSRATNPMIGNRGLSNSALGMALGDTPKINARPMEVAAAKVQSAWGKAQTAVGKVQTSIGKVSKSLGRLGGVVKGLGIMAGIGVAMSALDGIFGSTIAGASQTEAAISELSSKGIESMDELFSGIKNNADSNVPFFGDGGHTLRTAMERAFDPSVMQQAEGGLQAVIGAAGALFGQDWPTEGEAIQRAFEGIGNELANMSYTDATTTFRQLKEQADELGVPIEELVDSMPQYRDQVRILAEEQGITLETTEDYADAMAGLNPEIVDLEKKTRLAEEAEARWNEEREQTLRMVEAEQDALNTLIGIQDKAAGRWRSAEEDQNNFALALMDAQEQLKETGTTFDTTTREGLENSNMIIGLADNAVLMATNIRDAGGGVDGFNESIAESREEIRQMLEQAGYTGNIDAFLDKLGLVPTDLDIRVALRNLGVAEESIDRWKVVLDNVPPEVRSDILTDLDEGSLEVAQEKIDQALSDKRVRVLLELAESDPFDVRNLPGNLGKHKSSGKTVEGPGMATGGRIVGPGTDTSDSIPIMASNDEYMIRASSAKRIGHSTLDYINRTGELPRGYATGGRIRRSSSMPKVSRTPRASDSSGVFSNTVASLNSFLGALDTTADGAYSWSTGLVRLWEGMSDNLVGTTSQTSSIINSLFQTMLTQVFARITSMRPSMESAWVSLMSAMRKPISDGMNWLNGSLGNAVNKLTSFYGSSEDSPFPLPVPGFDGGGWTGPGSRLQPAGIVHADEYVIQKSSRGTIEREHPGALDYMNRTGKMPGFADGGRVYPLTSRRESGTYSGHSGIDYPVPIGTPVRAMSSGIVDYAGWGRGYGLALFQTFADGFKAVYGHLSKILVGTGSLVKAGQAIALSGNSGRSTGPHLHAEVTNGSFGRASNRALTRRWLSGAVSGPGDGIAPWLFGVSGLSTLDAASVFGDADSELKTMQGDWGSPWGNIVGSILTKVSDTVQSGISENLASAISAAVSGDFGSQSQRSNAFGIIDIAMKRGFGDRGALLGLMAAMQESGLKNINYGDRDSVGLFQQRPSAGWGSVSQIMDPSYSTNKFFDSLARKSWQSGPEWEDIQAVQISAFPRAYQKHKARAEAYLAEWKAAKAQGFSEGGWTGPGNRLDPAGIVHADEYVINKKSRKSIERAAPGVLDYMNGTGRFPGYAEGGRVAPAKFKSHLPRDLRGYSVFLSYLQEAQDWDAKRGPGSSKRETRKHARILEHILANEGLLDPRRIDGHLGIAEREAWKKWQRKLGQYESGIIDYESYAPLMNAYKIPHNSVYPFAPGYDQPSKTDALTGVLNARNKQMAEFMTYLNKIRGWGLSRVFEDLKALGPLGTPAEFEDSVVAVNGLSIAKELASDLAAARRYDSALQESQKYDEQSDPEQSKLTELINLIRFSPTSPMGLQTLAKELGLSIDTAAALFKKANSNGAFKDVSSSRLSRVRGDVVDFDNLFKFARGGIVPGVGNTDSVHALLTPGELVIPKDVTQALLRGSVPLTPHLNLNGSSVRRRDGAATGGGATYNFNTTVVNPKREEPSMSIQRRVRSLAILGLLHSEEG